MDVLMLPNQNAPVREIALAFYYRHKIGMRQSENLRILTGHAEQHPTLPLSIWPGEGNSTSPETADAHG